MYKFTCVAAPCRHCACNVLGYRWRFWSSHVQVVCTGCNTSGPSIVPYDATNSSWLLAKSQALNAWCELHQIKQTGGNNGKTS